MRRIRIGSVFGIPVRLDLTFLLVLPVFAYLIGTQVAELTGVLDAVWGAGIAPEALSSGMTPWLLGTVAALGLFVSVVLHEFGHAVVAVRFGHGIESITLWVFGGVTSFAEMPGTARRELRIAAAGPLASLFVGVGCYLAVGLLPEMLHATRFVFGYLAIVNVGLAGINLLPGLPLDGGRVLRAALARSRSYPHATRVAASVGKGIALLIGVAGLLRLDVYSIAVAFFIYIGASDEVQTQLVRNTFEGITVRDIMTPAADIHTVTPDTCIVDLLERMFRQRHVGYPVVRHGAVVGMVTMDDVSAVAPIERDVLTVEDVMTADLETISPDADVLDALAELHRHDIGRVLVTDGRGELVGILTRTDLMRAFTTISQTGRPESEEASPTSESSPTVRLKR